MRASILSIGSEILRGDIVDTNAAFLAREVTQIGFEMYRVTQVGDLMEDLVEAVRAAVESSSLILATGGLGPTQDDLTRQAIAAVLDEETQLDDGLLEEIAARFRGMGRPMPRSNNQQALLIPSAQAIPNPNGTAPGWYVRKNQTIIVAMPGPPHEMQPMWNDWVQPRVEALLPGAVAMRALMSFGLGESTVEERIEDILHRYPGVIVATYAKANGIQVHITARAETPEEAERLASRAEAEVRERLGKAVFGHGDQSLSEVVGALLSERGLTLATMESCTGGDLANLVTNSAGSSAYFRGGVVAYTEQAKAAHGVDQETMTRHGLISPETAVAMARSARQQFGTDAGLGVTGIAGSDPVDGRPPGTVYLGLSMGAAEEVREIHRPGPRHTVKRYAAQCALDLLRRSLDKQGTV